MKENFETIFDSDKVDFHLFYDERLRTLLKDPNSDYSKCYMKNEKVLNKYPNLRKFLEDSVYKNLTKAEYKAFHLVKKYESEMFVIMQEEVFRLGAKNLYMMLKNFEK